MNQGHIIVLIRTISLDQGKTLNYQVEHGYCTVQEIVDAALHMKPQEIYYLAMYMKDAPIDKIADGIIKTGDAKSIFEFGEYISDAPMDKLADGIIKTGDAKYIYYFARDIGDAPIAKLADGIIKTGDAHYIYLFAEHVKGAPIDKLLANSTVYEKDNIDSIKGMPKEDSATCQKLKKRVRKPKED